MKNKKLNINNYGLLAGNGNLPIIVADVLKKKKQQLTVFCFDDVNFEYFKKHKYNVSKIFIDDLLDILYKLRDNKIRNVICCGGVKFKFNKKSLLLLKCINAKAFVSIIKMTISKQKGDDFLLSLAEKILNSIGCNVVGVQDVLPNLLCKKTDEVNAKFAKKYEKDIIYGMNILKTNSIFDIGQAVVIQNGRVLGIEAVEGTAKLLIRCSEHVYDIKKKPVLIKTSKMGQNKKLDVPSIGLETIQAIVKYGYAGIAIENSSVFIINKKEVLKFAKDNDVFIKIL